MEGKIFSLTSASFIDQLGSFTGCLGYLFGIFSLSYSILSFSTFSTGDTYDVDELQILPGQSFGSGRINSSWRGSIAIDLNIRTPYVANDRKNWNRGSLR